ncbi:Modifying wall lignin-1/2 protein [Dioscorea alata]|uniref:Modifying wall lignin-1/2 protein n=1 Tax=Dioscorea alata TaxID=55571 RepID=A0ACB7WWJ4_DIOAL|nr:Modifying wall lignin-1/2 protein [Dioscorea alata]
MERKVALVCGAVGFLGLLAAALAFGAEATRVKISDVETTSSPDGCIYPESPASPLGLTAALALLVAQLIINIVAGCVCCKRHQNSSNSNWTLALISLIVSWITFTIAFLLLLTGAALNDQRTQQNLYCYVVKPGVFAAGALLSLATVSLAIIYYVSLSTFNTANTPQSNQNQSIAMVQPEIPPQSTEPVFVHEDTYKRRQFP